jgi:pimeloyl-ACP methyl ester carboxylesterase
MLAELGMVLGDPGHRLGDRAGHPGSSALGRGCGSSEDGAGRLALLGGRSGPAEVAGRDLDLDTVAPVSGLDSETCQAVLDEHVPGGIAQTVKDADTLFGIELPAIGAWAFGPEQAAAIVQPVLSVLGTETVRLFVEGRPLLHSWFPRVEDATIEGVGHLLHIQRPRPVARAMAGFLARNAMTAR